jgi:hypothetical protein
MKKGFIIGFCFGICLFWVVIYGSGYVAPILNKLNKWTAIQGDSYGKTSFTGFFSPYMPTGADVAEDFNSQVKKWFTERGFVKVEDFTPRAPICPNGDKDAGVLLLLERNPKCMVYIFIPDFRPESKSHYIGFHADWEGTIPETLKYEDDFNKLKEDFYKQFPTGQLHIE